MKSNYFFSLDAIKPQKSYPKGSLTTVTSKEMPGLVDMSFSFLKLNPNGTEEPIWHPNANKLGYCLKGKGLVSIRTPHNEDKFAVNAGDIFFIPEGYIHSITNSDDQETQIIFALNNITPQTMTLSKSVSSLSDSVFSATFNSHPGFVDSLKKDKNHFLIKQIYNTKQPENLRSSE